MGLEDKTLRRKSKTGAGTNAGVTVTVTGSTGEALVCEEIEVSGDAAAVVTVESPSGTILYQKRFASAFAMSEAFPFGSIVGPVGQNMLVKISASTSNCEANIQVASIPA